MRVHASLWLAALVPSVSCVGVHANDQTGAGAGGGAGGGAKGRVIIGVGGASGSGAQVGGALEPTADGGDPSLADGPATSLCALQRYALPSAPSVLLWLQDRAASMTTLLPIGGLTRWDASAAAALTISDGPRAALSWALKLFPDSGQSCAVASGVDVAPAAMNAPRVAAALAAALPTADGVPTTAAVKAAADYLSGAAPSQRSYVVLITDAAPNCLGGGIDSGAATADYDGAVAAISAAAAQGIGVAVIGIAFTATVTANGGEVALNRMAAAGGMARAGGPPSYYPVSSPADLNAAVGTIADQVASCTFVVDQPPSDLSTAAVNLNGKRVARDQAHLDGWDWGLGATSVVFFGRACTDLTGAPPTAPPAVELIVGCAGSPIP
jgi:hypothetical protein